MSPSGPILMPVSTAPVGSGTVATVTKVPARGSIFWIAPEKFEAKRFPSPSDVIDSGSCRSAGSKLTTTAGCWGLPGGAAATNAPAPSTADKPAAIETMPRKPTVVVFVIVMPPRVRCVLQSFRCPIV
jgi:hypothetical protein